MKAVPQNNYKELSRTTHTTDRYTLPVTKKPVLTIEANKTSIKHGLLDLWAYRELLYFLMWRDIKARYKQTAIGATWAILQPLVTMFIFTYFFGTLARVPSNGIPYPIFFYSGLLVWTFFSNALINSANSLIGDTSLITKIYFPRMIIPGAAVGGGLIDFIIAASLLIILMIYYNVKPTWGLLMLPVLVALATIFALGAGMLLSALNVRYRDVRQALPFTIQALMFLTPIIYPENMVPEQWRWILRINPLTGIVEAFRASLFGHPFNWPALLISISICLTLLAVSSYIFRRLEASFAEYI